MLVCFGMTYRAGYQPTIATNALTHSYSVAHVEIPAQPSGEARLEKGLSPPEEHQISLGICSLEPVSVSATLARVVG